MNWYISFILLFGEPLDDLTGILRGRRCHCLISAQTDEDAFEKALGLGQEVRKRFNRTAKAFAKVKTWRFKGLEELIRLDEKPTDETELFWESRELPSSAIEKLVRPIRKLQAFDKGSLKADRIKWYVAEVLLEEVHDQGAHGDSQLVWVNTYLIKASDPDAAYAKAVRVGEEQTDEPGSHTCDGEKAHWQFRGLRDLIPVRDGVRDGAILWVDRFEATEQENNKLVANKFDLAIFRRSSALRSRFQSMEHSQIKLTLIRAADDPPLRNQAYQHELRNFKESIQSQGFKVSSGIESIEAAAGVDSQEMATYFGGFIIQLRHSPFAAVIASATGAWLHAKYGRKVRLKIGDIETEAQTEKQVRTLLDEAEEFQKLNNP